VATIDEFNRQRMAEPASDAGEDDARHNDEERRTKIERRTIQANVRCYPGTEYEVRSTEYSAREQWNGTVKTWVASFHSLG
jgi:hypothetical protein